MISTKSGVSLEIIGTVIVCSDGAKYILSGDVLCGPGGFMRENTTSMQTAIFVVVERYGGRA